ncbi:TPA: YbjN domain-containing protein [Corynebacterium striatum]|uniref:YbjN domain-containing protein n=1 Tax=Corynebacterium TaxID=1716 RepID=UPI0011C8FCAB|nr:MULTISPECIES: YbjN domain-containing protein [Corynebacterium]TXS62634.1 hypothetical protein CHU71_09860 [Corynebacterium sp. LK14]HBC7267183.1 YbjN domain-containing protein [Corynebacterium striatum]
MCNSCENKSLSRFGDDARPVTLTRIMGALREVGIDFHVEGSESDILVVEFSRFTVLIALDGAYGQLFSLKAVPKVNVHSSRAADLAFAVSESNNRLLWPASSFTEKEDGYLEVAITIRYELRAGLSDTQLEDMIDISMCSVQTALEILSEHVPELAGVPDGFTERFGESNTGTLVPVTLERVQRVLAAEGIENVEMEPEEQAIYAFINGYYFVFRMDGRRWMSVRAYFDSDTAKFNYGELLQVLNDFNAGEHESMAHAASSDDHIGIALEQHFLVDRGMSAGQIGCAIHGAIFGHLDAISELEPVVKHLVREDAEIEGPYLDFDWEDEADPEQLETPDN